MFPEVLEASDQTRVVMLQDWGGISEGPKATRFEALDVPNSGPPNVPKTVPIHGAAS